MAARGPQKKPGRLGWTLVSALHFPTKRPSEFQATHARVDQTSKAAKTDSQGLGGKDCYQIEVLRTTLFELIYNYFFYLQTSKCQPHLTRLEDGWLLVLKVGSNHDCDYN
jgi:hypothetical protein